MKRSKHDLTQGGITRNLLHLAVPIFLSSFFQDAFNVVDMIFVGKLGKGAIAAVGMSGQILRLISVLSLGVSMGTMIMVSQFIGAKKRAEGEHIAMQALFLSVVCALGLGVFGYPFAELGLRLIGAEPDVVQLGAPYMRVMLLGAVAMFLSMTLGSIFRGAGDAMTPLIVLLLSTFLNIFLDPLLIFGLWGFPRLGVVGSAYASVIGRGVGVFILLFLCFNGRGVISLRHVERKIDLAAIGRILRLGIFSSMQGFLRHASRIGFMRVVNIYGTDAAEAYIICMRLRIVVMHLGFGFANAVSPMVGQNLGANRIDRAEKSAHIASRYAIAIMTVIGGLLFFAPHWPIGWFTDRPEVLDIGGVYLRFLSVTFGFIAFSLVLGRALNGAGDTVSPMAITGICQIGVGLILVIVLSYLMGMVGIWIGIALSNIVQGLMMWYWFSRGAWKAKKLVHAK